MSRALRLAAAAAVMSLLAGCGFKGAYSLPLPGGAAHGKTYTVTAQFRDVQDLVPQNAVRVNDVAVGDVTGINVGRDEQNRIVADVRMKINASVHLPANAVATLAQTTLLGEKYVALGPPDNEPAEGTLAPNTIIKDGDTSQLPDVEEVFGALSQVLNGGSLGDLQTINIEITKALSGREEQVRGALKQLDTFVSGLNKQKSEIVRALDQLDRFSGILAKQTGTIGAALDNIGPGLRVLADERAQFTGLLTKLSTFGRVASHVINASRADTVADFRDLQPVLQHLAAAGSNLPHALEILLTFPFPKAFSRAAPGDYAGLRLTFNADPIFCAILGTGGIQLPACPSMSVNTTPTKSAHHKTHHKSTTGAGKKSTKASKNPLKGIVKKLLPTPLPSAPSLLGGLLPGVGVS